MGHYMKKIVVNALQYKTNSSGIGIMIRDLFCAVTKNRKRIQIIVPQDSPPFPAGKGTEVLSIPYGYKQNIRRIWYQTFVLGRKYCQDAVLLTTDSKTPFFLPKSCWLIPIITDLGLYCIPEAYQLSRIVWWRIQFRYLKRHAKFFIAVSHFTKAEMTRILNIAPEKIYVVPCACGDELHRIEDNTILDAIRIKYHISDSYFLFVGSNNPRKNIHRLLRAFDKAKQQGIAQQLVIAGECGWKFNREEALRGVRYREAIKFIGYVPDEDMAALYSASDGLLFPTLYEGFGIPVIEAQKCGTPVLTSNQSSLPEVGGDGALYVDPYDVEDICKGILKLHKRDDIDVLVKKGYRNAEKYSWAKSANILLEIIEKCTDGESNVMR